MTGSKGSERRCTECGAPQHVERKTVMYPESGLENVQLVNVPVWICDNGHEEVVIPAVSELHELIAHSIIRKPAPLTSDEIRFLRRRVDLSAKEFAARLGITPVHLSRIENSVRRQTKPLDLLIRLAVATLIASRDAKPFPSDLAPFVNQLEDAWDVGTHRLKHVEQALPEEDEWIEASAS